MAILLCLGISLVASKSETQGMVILDQWAAGMRVR